MKTSLNIDPALFKEAQKESLKTGMTISQIISLWARKGREVSKIKTLPKKKFKPVNLGKPTIDLTNRKAWMEILEE